MEHEDSQTHYPPSPCIPRLKLFSPYSPGLNMGDFDLSEPKVKRPLTARSTNRPQTETVSIESSRAVAMAMKALQTKLRGIEQENEALKQTVKDLEERCLADKERSLVQQQAHQDIEQQFGFKAEEMQAVLDELTAKLKDSFEKRNLLEDQKSRLEADLKLTELKGSTTKSHMQQKVSDLQTEVEESARRLKKYKAELAKTTGESMKLATQLKKSNDLLESMQQELIISQESAERNQGALQDNILHMEAELSKLNAEYLQTVTDLEDKNFDLNERHREHSQIIEQLRREVESLKGNLAREEESKMKLLKKMSDLPVHDHRESTDFRLEYGQTLEVKPPERRVSNLSTPYLDSKESSSSQRKDLENLDLTTNITKLETEITELKKMYRRTLKRSYTDEIDSSKLRNELSAYTKELESKNMLLYRLKRMRQAGEGARAAQMLAL